MTNKEPRTWVDQTDLTDYHLINIAHWFLRKQQLVRTISKRMPAIRREMRNRNIPLPTLQDLT